MSDEPIVNPADEEPVVDDAPLVDDEDLPIEADPADAVDQRREVPLDDERDILPEGDSLVDDRDGLGGYEL